MWNIKSIEAMTEQEARAIALETLSIKGHTIYLIDFGKPFGYSACVYAEGMHIHYANDYELHHTGKTREELRAWYIDALNRKLYTEAELGAPATDYVEYERRGEYLRNYYPMRRPRISMFFIGSDEEREARRKMTESMYWDAQAYAWFYDLDFVKHHQELYAIYAQAEDSARDSFDYWKSAFKYEMANHEYAINWQGNWDVLTAMFGSTPYNEDDDPRVYMDALRLSDIQKQAFWAARKEYARENTERDD